MQRRRKREEKSGKVDQYKRDSGHEVWDAGVPLFTRILSVKDRTKIKEKKTDFSGLLGSTRTISKRVKGPMRLHWRGISFGR